MDGTYMVKEIVDIFVQTVYNLARCIGAKKSSAVSAEQFKYAKNM